MQSTQDIRNAFQDLSSEAERYFTAAASHASVNKKDDPLDDIFPRRGPFDVGYFWSQLPTELQGTGSELIERLLVPCANLAELARTSALTGSEDTDEVKLATKAMRSALLLRKYTYFRADVLHDEGRALGFQPAYQSEQYSLSPKDARNAFFEALATLTGVLDLVESAPSSGSNSPIPVESARYRAGTAFIMMWMDPAHPELNDVADTVRAVFKKFGVNAVRADDIEHDGLISERVLNEIKTAEFLFADLSGTRPNVYYEIGYAHALGKRVILFRKTGTSIHFDLAGYNCPEYASMRELNEKLTRRLIEMTNRNPLDPKPL